MPKSEKPSEPTEDSFFQAMLRLVEQENPKLAALVRKNVETHREAVKAGRWKPLR